MKTDRKVLHVISDVATPHNNVLMTAVQESGECTLHLYYSTKTSEMYSWGEEVFQGVGKLIEMGKKRICLPLILHALCRCHENYLFIGWPNNTARLLLLLFWASRRPFLFWSDYPNEDGRHYPAYISLLRSFLYHIVKTRAHRIFLVGQHTVEHFRNLGFPKSKLVNLPIFIRIDKRKADFVQGNDTVRKRYKVCNGELLFVSGSRLTEAKGYGDLIGAVKIVTQQSQKRFRVVIVGKGEQEEELRTRTADLGLSDTIIIEPWMEPGDFESLIACADVYIHPARFDAFGGGTLHAMTLGVPIIGSDGAGVVTERVRDSINGLVFPAGDVRKQANCICWFLEHPEYHDKMGKAARKTAEEWPPSRGAQIIIDDLICRNKH